MFFLVSHVADGGFGGEAGFLEILDRFHFHRTDAQDEVALPQTGFVGGVVRGDSEDDEAGGVFGDTVCGIGAAGEFLKFEAPPREGLSGFVALRGCGEETGNGRSVVDALVCLRLAVVEQGVADRGGISDEADAAGADGFDLVVFILAGDPIVTASPEAPVQSMDVSSLRRLPAGRPLG